MQCIPCYKQAYRTQSIFNKTDERHNATKNIFKMVFLINVIFLKVIILLIQVTNTIDRNMESKVLKTLDDDATSRLIAKIISIRPTHLIIQKCLEYLMSILNTHFILMFYQYF